MEDLKDPDIDELKQIVKRQGAVIEETNKMIRGMRSAQRWHTFVRLLWWAAILGLSAVSYYYYVQPYLTSILNAYQQAQHGVQQAQSFQQTLADIFKRFFEQIGAASSTPSH
jgi:type II secretory pathway component PulM